MYLLLQPSPTGSPLQTPTETISDSEYAWPIIVTIGRRSLLLASCLDIPVLFLSPQNVARRLKIARTHLPRMTSSTRDVIEAARLTRYGWCMRGHKAELTRSHTRVSLICCKTNIGGGNEENHVTQKNNNNTVLDFDSRPFVRTSVWATHFHGY